MELDVHAVLWKSFSVTYTIYTMMTVLLTQKERSNYAIQIPETSSRQQRTLLK